MFNVRGFVAILIVDSSRLRRRESQPTSRHGGADDFLVETAQRFVRRTEENKPLMGRRTYVPGSQEITRRNVPARHLQRIRSGTRR